MRIPIWVGETFPRLRRMTKQQDTLCESIKRLGYARNNQVKLYGEVFDLVSDPVSLLGASFPIHDFWNAKDPQAKNRLT